MIAVRERKKELRDKYKIKRRELDYEYRAAADNKISSLITSLATYRFADTVLMYYPKSDEVNILSVCEKAFADGKTVCFPKCGEDGIMDFYKITSLDCLSPGAFGILEPDLEKSELIPKESLCESSRQCVCLIPALLYDRAGYRLGYGKGFYDRYLSSFRGTKIGIVYSGFVIDEVPRGRYDLAADVIVTEKGVVSFYEG